MDPERQGKREPAPRRLPGSRLLPGTLFGRLFLVTSLISATVAGLSAWLLASQAIDLLDQQAGRALLSGARSMARELRAYEGSDPQGFTAALFERVFGSGQGLGWIRNTYWIDIREGPPRFRALLSLPATEAAALLPPTVEDIEDLLDDALPELEEGRPAFPDPQVPGGARRYKIVLCPLSDDDGITTGIVGLEADFHYLEIRGRMTEVLRTAILAGILLSVVMSWLLARSVSRRVDRLLEDLDRVARRSSPDAERLGIAEFDRLREGLSGLGAAIAAGDQRLHAFHENKLAELSLTGAAIAHEVRNPLAAMELHLGLLKRRIPPETACGEEFREIEAEMAAMKDLTDRFLDYSRRVTPACRPIDLGPWLTELLTGLAQRHSHLHFETMIPVGLVASLDPGMARQIVENLVGNAAQARPEDLLMRVSAALREEASSRTIVLTFADNGPGVPPDLVPRLFSPFAGLRPGGHGIGLALVRKLVEAHHGTILYRPGASGGAEFIIEVPEHA